MTPTGIKDCALRVRSALADGVDWADVPEVLRALADCAEKSPIVRACVALAVSLAAGKISTWGALSQLLPAALAEITD